jgi:hypothetical protein
LLLANFGKEGRPEPIMAKISQEVLAEMIGTTRSRLSHFMNKFREHGFIDYNGHLEVHIAAERGFKRAGANRGADSVRPARQLPRYVAGNRATRQGEIRSEMNDKLLLLASDGSVCRKCDGKGYRLIDDGQLPRKFPKIPSGSPPPNANLKRSRRI